MNIKSKNKNAIITIRTDYETKRDIQLIAGALGLTTTTYLITLYNKYHKELDNLLKGE